MSTSSTTTITVLISVILATSAFIAVAESQQIQMIKINEEQAINILKESNKTNHMITWGGSPSSIQLEYISINWQSYLGNIGYHSRLYVSTTPVGEVEPYWIIEYEDHSIINLGGGTIYSKYVVDAQTGEVMLSFEIGGGIVRSLGNVGDPVTNTIDYSLSFQPEAWNQSTPLIARMGENTSVKLTLTAEPEYDASLPASINVTNVPLGYKVEPGNASAVLSTGGSVSFTLSVFQPVPYPADFLPPPTDPHPHFNVDVSFLGQSFTYEVYVLPSNK